MGTAQAIGDSAGRRGTARAAVCVSEVLPWPPMGIGLDPFRAEGNRVCCVYCAMIYKVTSARRATCSQEGPGSTAAP